MLFATVIFENWLLFATFIFEGELLCATFNVEITWDVFSSEVRLRMRQGPNLLGLYIPLLVSWLLSPMFEVSWMSLTVMSCVCFEDLWKISGWQLCHLAGRDFLENSWIFAVDHSIAGDGMNLLKNHGFIYSRLDFVHVAHGSHTSSSQHRF